MRPLPAYIGSQSPRQIKITSIYFDFRYLVYPAMPYWTWLHSYMSEPPHVLNPKIRHLYETRDPNTLWWRAVTHHLNLKKVIRNDAANRFREVFCDILRMQGYDSTGRPLPQEKLPKGVARRKRPLTGTLDIIIHEQGAVEYDSNVIKELMQDKLTSLMSPMQRRPLYEWKPPENS